MKLEVTPSYARVDETLPIRVSGCLPFSAVQVTAQMGEGDWTWTAQADFIADGDGTVDLTTSAPNLWLLRRPRPAGPNLVDGAL
jgi:hypothetical protein